MVELYMLQKWDDIRPNDTESDRNITTVGDDTVCSVTGVLCQYKQLSFVLALVLYNQPGFTISHMAIYRRPKNTQNIGVSHATPSTIVASKPSAKLPHSVAAGNVHAH